MMSCSRQSWRAPPLDPGDPDYAIVGPTLACLVESGRVEPGLDPALPLRRRDELFADLLGRALGGALDGLTK
jgi:hypothetical protein